MPLASPVGFSVELFEIRGAFSWVAWTVLETVVTPESCVAVVVSSCVVLMATPLGDWVGCGKVAFSVALAPEQVEQ
jgi:hypothetical protein